MPTIRLIHADTCLPDYFQGSPRQVFAVPVTGESTVKEVRDGVIQEFNDTWLDDDIEIDHFIAQTLYDFGQWFGDDETQRFDPRISTPDEDDDFGESVYAYFVLMIEDDEQ